VRVSVLFAVNSFFFLSSAVGPQFFAFNRQAESSELVEASRGRFTVFFRLVGFKRILREERCLYAEFVAHQKVCAGNPNLPIKPKPPAPVRFFGRGQQRAPQKPKRGAANIAPPPARKYTPPPPIVHPKLTEHIEKFPEGPLSFEVPDFFLPAFFLFFLSFFLLGTGGGQGASGSASVGIV
jgi:hypothetical protein